MAALDVVLAEAGFGPVAKAVGRGAPFWQSSGVTFNRRYGGLIRSRRVARMAELAGLATTVHLSGGFGFVYSHHFAACTPRIGPWQEYKKGVETYGQWFDPPLRIRNGALTIPQGPGVGLADPAGLLRGAVPV